MRLLIEGKRLQDSYAPIFKVRLLLRCAYFWVYTVYYQGVPYMYNIYTCITFRKVARWQIISFEFNTCNQMSFFVCDDNPVSFKLN